MKISLQHWLCISLLFLSGNSIAQSSEKKAPPTEPVVLDNNMPVVQQQLEDQTVATSIKSDVLLPARTPVKFFLNTLVTTKTAVPGEQFQLTVAEDVQSNGVVVITKGTPATGEIIHAQKAKGFGKAGELLVVIRYINHHGEKIKMRSFQPYQGNNKSTTVMAVSQIPYLGLFAGFIQGGDIEMPAQTLVQALIAADITIKPDQIVATSNTKGSEMSLDKTTITSGESK